MKTTPPTGVPVNPIGHAGNSAINAPNTSTGSYFQDLLLMQLLQTQAQSALIGTSSQGLGTTSLPSSSAMLDALSTSVLSPLSGTTAGTGSTSEANLILSMLSSDRAGLDGSLPISTFPQGDVTALENQTTLPSSFDATGFNAAIADPTGLASLPTALPSALQATANQAYSAQLPSQTQWSLPQIEQAIQQLSSLYGVNPNLVNAVVAQESGFSSQAISSAGAIGLMQLMPSTAAQLGVDPHNPMQNLQGGILYLRTLLDRYHGNTKLALAAYNAGPSAVDSYGGIPPYPETTNYVEGVLKRMSAQ